MKRAIVSDPLRQISESKLSALVSIHIFQAHYNKNDDVPPFQELLFRSNQSIRVIGLREPFRMRYAAAVAAVDCSSHPRRPALDAFKLAVLAPLPLQEIPEMSVELLMLLPSIVNPLLPTIRSRQFPLQLQTRSQPRFIREGKGRNVHACIINNFHRMWILVNCRWK